MYAIRSYYEFSASDELFVKVSVDGGPFTVIKTITSAESMLFDYKMRTWAFDRIQSLKLSSEIFPPLVEAGQKIVV